MQRTLNEHIAYLEQKIEGLKKELESPTRSQLEKTETKIDLGIAERALVHFQQAFVLEQKLSKSIQS